MSNLREEEGEVQAIPGRFLKRCSACKVEKPIDEFVCGAYKCRSCSCAYNRAHYQRNKGKIRVQGTEYRQTEEGKIAGRRVQLKYKHGISLEEYRVLYQAQDGKCAVCGLYQKTLYVDHCHKTGKIRGLLCCRCNLVLGQVKDNTIILRSLAIYLEQTKGVEHEIQRFES